MAASEALDDAAAAGTALAAAGSLNAHWRGDAGALFRCSSGGVLGPAIGGLACGRPAGSMSAPTGVAPGTGVGNSVSSIWALQPSDFSSSRGGGLGLGTSPVARVLFPQALAMGHRPVGAGTVHGHVPVAQPQWRLGRAAVHLPTEGELLLAMAAPEGQDE